MSAGPAAPAAGWPDGGRFGRVRIVLDERRLEVDGRPVALGSRAFDLLAALAARRDRIVPKDELIDVVWPGLVVEDNNLQVQISALRKVLGAQAIATVPARGYQFTVAAAAAAAPAAPPPVRKAAAAAARSRLLVADDNKVNRLLLCRSLSLLGHDVSGVDDGHAALAALRGGGVDLLLLDLEMPALDGYALLEQRAGDAALRDVPVIVTSSVEGATAMARCIELGADDFLHKPVNPLLLKARVAASLERKHLRDRERQLLARLAPAPGAATAEAATLTAAALLAARLHGLDAAAAAQPAAATLEQLADWTTLMLDAIEAHGGALHRIAGDGLAAVFGGAGAVAAALRAALEMRASAAQLDAERAAAGGPALGCGIGIACGDVVSGRAGTPERIAWVCVGAAVGAADALAAHGAGLLVDATARGAACDIVGAERLRAAGAAFEITA